MTTTPPLWALGLMSGTSADGVDGALIQTDGNEIISFGPTHYVPYPDSLRQQILKAYGRRPPENGLKPLSDAIITYHALCVEALLKKTKEEVSLIGFHGQAIFHAPPETYQIGEGAQLASLTGIPVIEQMRLNDLAHGGQGAPLSPLFHKALSTFLSHPLGFLNIGGVANITWIGPKTEDLLAFDIGPGNGLIDDWVREKTSLPYDKNGVLASQGQIHLPLLKKWSHKPFFSLPPPKSLDRTTFQDCLEDIKDLSLQDAVATLTAFTAYGFERALDFLPAPPGLWVLCGGGAHNATLLHLIRSKTKAEVKKATELGWEGDALEAQAWGFLAVRSLYSLPLSFPSTTGVSMPVTGGRLCLPEPSLLHQASP